MNDNLTLVNKISLLALLPLLAGTANGVLFALIFALSLSFIALIVKFIYLINESFFDQKEGQIILWGLGFGISYFLSVLLPQILGAQSQYFNYYFILIGVTPLVYADLKNKRLTQFVLNHTLFLDLMLAVSILRELLGQGSLLNYQIFSKAPLSIANRPSGAFLILAISAFIYEILTKKLNLETYIKNDESINLGSEEK